MDALAQAAARLTVHEFALEVMMANWIADMAEDDGDSFLSDFCERCRRPWTAGEFNNSDELRALAQEGVAIADNFARKVSERAAEIREHRRRTGARRP